jgi:uncharacterized protein (TIGR02444 family)
MTALSLDGPHWSFALRLYRQPGVADACLALQDRVGVDVNILLFALFAAIDRGIPLDEGDIEDMDRAVAPWRSDVVQALRTIRRRVKNGPEPAPNMVTEALRDQIKRAELAAEQIEQAVLARWLGQRHAGQAAQQVDIGGVVARVLDHYRQGSSVLGAAGASEIDGLVQALLQAAAGMNAKP